VGVRGVKGQLWTDRAHPSRYAGVWKNATPKPVTDQVRSFLGGHLGDAESVAEVRDEHHCEAPRAAYLRRSSDPPPPAEP
jgi:hypothetical protein